MIFVVATLLDFSKSVCRAVLVQPPLTSQGFISDWHFAVVTQGSLFYTQGVWLFAVTIKATRGLKGCRADWEMGHIICPWNILWHNMTLGYLYVKVNISAWQFNKSGQSACQCGFIVCAVKEVLWHRVAVWCRASAHKFNPHKVQASWIEKVFVRLLLFCVLPAVAKCWRQSVTEREILHVKSWYRYIKKENAFECNHYLLSMWMCIFQ